MSIKSEERLSSLAFALGIFITAVYLLTGCAAGGTTAIPSGRLLDDNPSTASELDEGRRLYMMACTDCHRRYYPADRPPGSWKEIIKRHRGRLSLTSVRFEGLESYIIKASAYQRLKDGEVMH